MSILGYILEAEDAQCAARAGSLHTAHGVIQTPAFMPVGTQATVKGLRAAELEALGAQVLLANTYHLYLRPGAELVERHGGLHGFMGWQRPLLTDSGGFQIFSLRDTLKLDADGVSFRSILDGSAHRWTPEDNMRVQAQLGADIIMQLDECPPWPAERGDVRMAVERTASWAERCLAAHASLNEGRAHPQMLFAIIQGGVHLDLRLESIQRALAIEAAHDGARSTAAPGAAAHVRFGGFGIGGYSVGESHDLMFQSLGGVAAALPKDRPRYLMGVGNPTTMLKAIGCGIDMFDCVLPTRTARMGTAFSSEGRLNLRNARFKDDPAPLDIKCGCPACTGHSRAYLRHLVASKEMLGSVLLSIHNLHFLLDLVRRARQAVLAGEYAAFLSDWLNSPASDDY